MFFFSDKLSTDLNNNNYVGTIIILIARSDNN